MREREVFGCYCRLTLGYKYVSLNECRVFRCVCSAGGGFEIGIDYEAELFSNADYQLGCGW